MGKKVLSLLLVAVLAIGLFAGCAQKTEETEGPKEETSQEKGSEEETPKEKGSEAETPGFRAGFVTDEGGIDDKSFNQATWEGVVKYAQGEGWEEKKEYTYIISNEHADYIPNLSTFGDDEYNIVVAAGYMFEKSMKEVAPQYPNSNFAIIDAVVKLPNVASIVFAEEQGSFLVGVAAAKSTKNKKVGFIGGRDSELIRKFHAGFVAGVRSVDKSIEVNAQYAGVFDNAGMGQQIASAMYEQDFDVIYHAAGGTGNGLINEAKNRAEQGEEVWVIGVDRDQYEDGKLTSGKSVVLTSMMKRVDVAAYNIIEQAHMGEFPGEQVISLTLDQDGVGIPKENPNLSKEIVEEVEAYKAKIINGDIVVPATMEDLETFEAGL